MSDASGASSRENNRASASSARSSSRSPALVRSVGPIHASFERVATFLLGEGDVPRVVALCAEPGSGRREALSGALDEASSRGWHVIRRDLRGLTPGKAIERILRASRRALAEDGPVVVCFDEVPPADEGDVARIARALRRLETGGVPVALSVDPEARQIMDAVPECLVLSAPDIACQTALGALRERTSDYVRLTRGIPVLMRALAPGRYLSTPVPSASLTYRDAVADLLRLSLRPSLSDEERRVRLAMVLLGSGSSDELVQVTGGPVDEVLEGLVPVAPLFGVAGDLCSFDCVSACSSQVLVASLRALEATCALFPDVVASSLRVLVERSDYGRAALVGTLPECRDSLEPVVEHGEEFLDAGQVRLVKSAVAARPEADGRAEALLAAAGTLGSRDARVAVPKDVSGSAPALLLIDARRFLQALPPACQQEEPAPGGLERALWAHRRACDLMAQGHFAAAMRLVISTPREGGRPSVAEELLDVDLELARVMSGESPDVAGSPGRERFALLEGGELPGLAGYAALLDLIGAVARGGGEVCASETLSARAERSGDVLLQAVALLAGCVIDLRRGLATRAHVRASIAVALAASHGLSYLERVGRTLDAMAGYLMGERSLRDDPRDEDDDLGMVQGLLWEAMGADVDPPERDVAPARVPWDALWLLRVACEGLGELSAAVERRVPSRWGMALTSLGAARGRLEPGAPAKGPAEKDAPAPVPIDEPQDAPVEIRLLGTFSVRVRGVRIADWKLDRRNAKSMLEYLVLRHGSGSRRYRLVEQVWPECDYVTGLSRVYQATSALRRAVAEIDPSISLFVTSRSSKEVVLDMGLVSCDVDEFRAVAREASDSESDERALELARRAERLYVGDLYLPNVDSTGFVAAMRDELRALYADAMVAGASAALRLGSTRTASRLARNALAVNDVREDAMVVLLRALRDSGRSHEATRQYDAFVARLSRQGAAAPSGELARIADSLARDGAGLS